MPNSIVEQYERGHTRVQTSAAEQIPRPFHFWICLE